MHQELTEAWQPDDVMQEMLVKTIGEKSWDKAQLRAAWMESQLTALQSAQIQAQRRSRTRDWRAAGFPAPRPLRQRPRASGRPRIQRGPFGAGA